MCPSALPHCDKILERNKSARDKLCLGSWFQSFSPCLLGFFTVTSGASERHGNSNMLWKREHQGNRGGQRIWEQDMGTERGSIDHVPSLDLPPRSLFSSEFIRWVHWQGWRPPNPISSQWKQPRQMGSQHKNLWGTIHIHSMSRTFFFHLLSARRVFLPHLRQRHLSHTGSLALLLLHFRVSLKCFAIYRWNYMKLPALNCLWPRKGQFPVDQLPSFNPQPTLGVFCNLHTSLV